VGVFCWSQPSILQRPDAHAHAVKVLLEMSAVATSQIFAQGPTSPRVKNVCVFLLVDEAGLGSAGTERPKYSLSLWSGRATLGRNVHFSGHCLPKWRQKPAELV